MKKPRTPFPTTGYYGKKYFCDRKDELELLLNNLSNGLSTTLISIRRMGKTGLIRHLMKEAGNEYTTIYIDILATESLHDFLNELATGVLRAVPEKTRPGQKVWNFIKSLRPLFSFDELTGQPQVSFNVGTEAASQSIKDIFRMMEEHNKKVIIAIDEFQQILSYPENNTDAWLRSIIQQLNNVLFIFSGSRQHLMAGLFTAPSRPFYRSTQILKLKEIPQQNYQKFILDHFHKHKKEIDEEVVNEMLSWTRRHTYYVQLLCSKVFTARENKITTKTWQYEAHKLLEEQKIVFFEYRQLLTKGQWNLLKAIAAEEKVFEPTAKDFLSKFGLGTSASVLRALDALINKELVYYDFNDEGEKYYSFYDLLFGRWVQNLK